MSNRITAQGRLRPLFAFPLLRTAAALLACLTILAAPLPAFAADDAAMVIDANTGKVLYSDAGDSARYPASLTKMMTLYLTFELIEKGRLKFDDKVRVSAQAAAQSPSKLGLDAGDQISVRNAILALVTKSANDVAVALAEHIGGSEANFARLMTTKAHAIGMDKTTFRNASGLPNSEQVTTARDMLTLAMRLQDDFPEHYKFFATSQFSYAGNSYRNHNTLLRSYQGTDGIKTGYTRASGFNLVSSVRRGGKHLVAAVFGGRTSGSRNARMRAILDRAFIKASSRRTRPRHDRPQLIAKPRPADRTVASALAPTKPPPLPRATPPAAATPPIAAAAPERRLAAAEPAPAPRDEALDPPAAEPAAAEKPRGIEDRISIARVRRVGITQHFARRRASAREAAVTAGLDPRPDDGPRSISELIASTAAAPPAPRTALGMQVNGAIVPAASATTPVGLAPEPPTEPAIQPPTPADEPPQRGRQPSSLQAQLSTILATNRPAAMDAATAPAAAPERATLSPALRPSLPPRHRPAAPTDGRSGTTAGTHLVQIGAFNSAEEAQRQLASARERASPVLASASAVTEAVTQGPRRLFRARFAGFDSAGATSACQELRRRSIDCFVTRTH